MLPRPELAVAIAAVTFALTACVAPTSTSGSEGGDAPASARAAAAPVSGGTGTAIAALKIHDGRISITSSAEGPRVTLTNLDGDVTAENLTLDQLRAQAPDAYRLVTSSRAFVDASIDRGMVDRGPREPGVSLSEPDFNGGRR
jgi:hypothetical protein